MTQEFVFSVNHYRVASFHSSPRTVGELIASVETEVLASGAYASAAKMPIHVRNQRIERGIRYRVLVIDIARAHVPTLADVTSRAKFVEKTGVPI